MANHEETTLRKEQGVAFTLQRLYQTQCDSVKKAYGRPSTRKVAIERYILSEMSDKYGWKYRILSHNGWVFSCGYLYETVDTETGEINVMMVIHTKSSRNEYNVTRFLRPINATEWELNDYHKAVLSIDRSF